MLKVMHMIVHEQEAMTQTEFFTSIDFSFSNLTRLKRGLVDFQHRHLLAVANKYNISIEWLYGLSPDMKRKPAKNKKQRVREIFTELQELIE